MMHTSATSRSRRHRNRRAFTLVELIVASIIGAMLTGAAVVSLQRAIKSRDRSRDRQAATAQVQALVRLIARDVADSVRHSDLTQAMLRIEDTGNRERNEQEDELLLFTRSFRAARPRLEPGDQYEGGIYEVQYRFEPPRTEDDYGVVWCRRDPMPDANYEGGGVALPMATNIRSLSFEAFDGSEWQEEWSSDENGYPYAVRITVLGSVGNSTQIVWARTTVALDRTPSPAPTPLDIELDFGGGLFGETSDNGMDGGFFGDDDSQPSFGTGGGSDR